MAFIETCNTHKLAYASDTLTAECPACELADELKDMETTADEWKSLTRDLEQQLDEALEERKDAIDDLTEYKEAHPDEAE